jgi:hypothetical protein
VCAPQRLKGWACAPLQLDRSGGAWAPATFTRVEGTVLRFLGFRVYVLRRALRFPENPLYDLLDGLTLSQYVDFQLTCRRGAVRARALRRAELTPSRSVPLRRCNIGSGIALTIESLASAMEYVASIVSSTETDAIAKYQARWGLALHSGARIA